MWCSLLSAEEATKEKKIKKEKKEEKRKKLELFGASVLFLY